MHKLICLSALLAFALPATAVAAPATGSAATKKKRKECEFTKKKAKKKKAKLCSRALGDSRWIVVSGDWKEKLTVHATDGDAVFDGSGGSDFQALGLNGDSAFPSHAQPVVSMVSTRPAGVTFSSSTQGGWTEGSRFYDCSFTAPAGSAPRGFGGIFSLSGKRVSVQWFVGAAGFGCADGPHETPSPRFPDPIATYPLASFQNRRLVVLPIAFDVKESRDSFVAHRTIDGVARLRRYR